MNEERLRISVAGRDRTADLGASVLREAQQRGLPWLERLLADEQEVLSLRSASTAEAFRARHLAALRSRWMVDPGRFSTPSGPGIVGAAMLWARMFLWRVFRYQHDWVVFRQNGINAQLFYALMFECEDRARQVRELEARVRDLEAQLGTAAPDRGRRP